jgi:alkyl sulfatase BDS1-like metallo-beta-lactamase superfamily hydrolase
MVFQLTPGTEAPAEMNTFFPQLRALWMAENATHTMHNLYTLRGAPVRDAKGWSEYINEAIERYGADADVVFAAHHWPTWDNARILTYLGKQRDIYKYLHDQTLRLANQGYTMLEIAEMMELPPELALVWSVRGYYGTVSHNVKAVYNRYLGFFDGNPANLHPLPPEDSAKRHVEFMGGADAVLKNARAAFDKGEYRWVAQVVNYVVFAEPGNRAARDLQADALEQLGYQAESGPWRNFYLSGAKELRDGVPQVRAPAPATADVIAVMTPEMFFDYMAIRLNGPKAAGRRLTFNFDFTDIGRKFTLSLENAVLNYVAGKEVRNADASFRMTRADFVAIMAQQATLESKVASGAVKVDGDPKKFGELVSLLDAFEFWFNIVTP